MRVAVYLPVGHPDAGGHNEPVAIAYRLGRIEEGVHNAPIGHPEVPLEEFVQGLVDQAKSEYPDAEVFVERLVDNGDGTGRWIPADEFVAGSHTPVQPGNIKSTEVHVTSEQQGA